MTGKVRVSSCAVSVDGFGAGPDQSLQNSLGISGERATHLKIMRKVG